MFNGIRSVVWKLLVLLLSLAALMLGFDRIPRDPDLLDPWFRKFIGDAQAWLAPGALIALGAALLTILFANEFFAWRVRRIEREHTEELRRAAGTDWRETDAAEVLSYLRNESAWAYRRYMHKNHWEMVTQDARDELRRLAHKGAVRLSGEVPNSSVRLKPIASGYWRRADISPFEEGSYGVYASLDPWSTHVLGETNLHHLRVSNADYEREWPRASLALRLWATIWVLLKRAFYRLPEGAWPLRWMWWDKIDDNHANEGPIRVRRKKPWIKPR